MAARSIASLTISFGLVAIPVKLFTATRSSGSIAFNLLHAKEGSRLRQQYVCLKEDVVVERDEIVKGYEFAKDQYVIFTPAEIKALEFTPAEIKALEEVGTHSIAVDEFVPLKSVDPVYFDRTYYLAPDKGGARPYALFARALEESGRCAIGRWASHGKDHVVLLRAVDQVIVVQQLHFVAEVRPVSEIGIDPVDVREAELALARKLIDQQSNATFDPGAYADEVKARIEAAVRKKVEGHEVKLTEPRVAGTDKVIDLMAALRASVERSSRARGDMTSLGARKPPRRAPREARRAGKATRR